VTIFAVLTTLAIFFAMGSEKNQTKLNSVFKIHNKNHFAFGMRQNSV
jgi:hypothetical protein